MYQPVSMNCRLQWATLAISICLNALRRLQVHQHEQQLPEVRHQRLIITIRTCKPRGVPPSVVVVLAYLLHCVCVHT